MKNLDCKGLNCPEPIIRTKSELSSMKGGEVLEVLLDNPAAAKNVARFAESQNCKVTKVQNGSDFTLTITKGGEMLTTDTITNLEESNAYLTNGNVVLFIKNATIGTGNAELGRVLINGFFNTVAQHESPPDKIFFVNGGVTLTVNNSDILQALKKLEDKGVEIYSCGTCLDFYGLKDELAIGKVGNMYDLVDNLLSKNVVYI
jgi:selenium metabolism protein YedF